jgi:hypothetical protein
MGVQNDSQRNRQSADLAEEILVSVGERKIPKVRPPDEPLFAVLACWSGFIAIPSFSIVPGSFNSLNLVNSAKQMPPTAIQESARKRLVNANAVRKLEFLHTPGICTLAA